MQYVNNASKLDKEQQRALRRCLAVLHRGSLMQEMQPYLSEEDDFSELTDISSSVFCLISGKIRKYSQPRPPALAVHSLINQRAYFPAPFCSEEAAATAVLAQGRPSRALRGRGGRRRAAPARAHDGARRRAEPFRGGGGGGGASPRRDPPRSPSGPRRHRRQPARGGASLRGEKPHRRMRGTVIFPVSYLSRRGATLENLQIKGPEKYGSLNHFCHKE